MCRSKKMVITNELRYMENNLNVQGFILLDVDVVALNNAGIDKSIMNNNNVKTKSILKNGRRYVYVSGQAWRYWWRNTLQRVCGWTMSPIEYGKDKKSVFTSANPITYDDDDMFGYMRAESEKVDGKSGKTDVSVTRVSPLKNSALVSVAAVAPIANFSTMSRQNDTPMPYSREEYSAIMKGMFSIDLNAVGTFSTYNRSGFKNLSDDLKQKALSEKGAREIKDPYGEGNLVQLPLDVRIKRAMDTIKALKNISGGAMQTDNLGDVTPKLIVLATTKTGNHPFSHIVKSDGMYDERASLNIDGIQDVIDDYKDDFVGKIFIGRRKGFFDEYDKNLNNLKDQEKNKDLIEYLPVNEAINKYADQLKEQMQKWSCTVSK